MIGKHPFLRAVLTCFLATLALWSASAARPQDFQTEIVVKSGGHAVFVRRNSSKEGIQRWLALGNKSHDHNHSKQSKAEGNKSHDHNLSKQNQAEGDKSHDHNHSKQSRAEGHPEPPNKLGEDNLLYYRFKKEAQKLQDGIDDVHYEVKNELEDRAHVLTQKSKKYTQGMIGIRSSIDHLRSKVKQYRNVMRKKFRHATDEMMSKLTNDKGFEELQKARNKKIPPGMWADQIVPAVKREIDEEYAKWMKGRPPAPKRRRRKSEEVEAANAAEELNPYWAPNVEEIYRQGYDHGYTNSTSGRANGLEENKKLKEAAAETWMWTDQSQATKNGGQNGIDWYKSQHLKPHEVPPKPFSPFTEEQLKNCLVDFPGGTKESAITAMVLNGWLQKARHKLVEPVYEWTEAGADAVDTYRLMVRKGSYWKPAPGQLCTNEHLAEIGGNMGPLNPEDGTEAGFLKRRLKTYELEWTKQGAIQMMEERKNYRTVKPDRVMPKSVLPEPGDPVTEEQIEWIEEMENADVDIESGIQTHMWRSTWGCSCRDWCPEKKYHVGVDDDGIDESLGKPEEELCQGDCKVAPEDEQNCIWEGPQSSPEKPEISEEEKLVKRMGLHSLPEGFYERLKPYLLNPLKNGGVKVKSRATTEDPREKNSADVIEEKLRLPK